MHLLRRGAGRCPLRSHCPVPTPSSAEGLLWKLLGWQLPSTWKGSEVPQREKSGERTSGGCTSRTRGGGQQHGQLRAHSAGLPTALAEMCCHQPGPSHLGPPAAVTASKIHFQPHFGPKPRRLFSGRKAGSLQFHCVCLLLLQRTITEDKNPILREENLIQTFSGRDATTFSSQTTQNTNPLHS